MQKLIPVEDAVLRDTFWNAAIDLKKENDALKDRIKMLENLQLKEEHLSEIERENKRLKEQNKRQNELIDSLRIMYAKEIKP
jgi:flagellar motility protein MotE (MotC chaperone)